MINGNTTKRQGILKHLQQTKNRNEALKSIKCHFLCYFRFVADKAKTYI